MKSAFTVKWLMAAVAALIKSKPQLKKAIELKKTGVWENYKPVVDETILNMLNPLMDLAEIKCVVNGKDNIPLGEPVIYTPNHQGIFDFPSLILSIPSPCAFISKKEAEKLPIIHKWMWVMDCVFIDRNNNRAAHDTLNDAIDIVKAGRSMVVFPEGTRSKDGQIGRFRGGAMKIAMETGAKVVPVLIEGTRERFELTGNIVPGTIYVTFLPAIETKGLSRERFKSMPGEIREMIAAEREKQRAETGITEY